MTALFGNLSTAGVEEAQDRLGGGFQVFESDAYTGSIKLAYAGKSTNSNAQSVTIVLDLDDGRGEYRETFWVTNKEGNPFYVDTKDGNKKKPLAGFTHINDICLVTIDKELNQAITEEKVINLYDYDQKKEVPTSVQMLVELLGKRVTFGIRKKLVNKQVKDSNGVYQDTADEREENETDKIFHHPSNLTVLEAKAKKTDAVFYGAWVEKNRGKTIDRRSIKGGAGAQGGTAGRPGMPPKAGDSAPKTTSLFN